MFVSTCVYIEIADFSTFWDGAIRVALTHLVFLLYVNYKNVSITKIT